jgi:hypothetical protein
MKRIVSFSNVLAVLVLLGVSLGGAGTARAQVVISPPSVVIATSQPVYYQGHPSYWYGGHWYWRDHQSWHSYGSEPGYLHDHRVHGPPQRHYYEHRR